MCVLKEAQSSSISDFGPNVNFKVFYSYKSEKNMYRQFFIDLLLILDMHPNNFRGMAILKGLLNQNIYVSCYGGHSM